ncbi:HET domain-containing protein [Fusarium sp. LHS14.1]|nr:HET domain-containing protein [Fusarium sp. LHS14.1]
MTASQENSSHPPLDHSKRQIRLLSISEDADGKIACDLSVFDLSSCPPFIALSYVWGSPSVQHEITLNGYAFFIRHNLYSALKSISNHLKTATGEQAITNNSPEAPSSEFNADGLKRFHQSPGCWKYFWIDAICINQNEVSERNHQVRMMSHIYKGAVFVLVWFGPSCEKALYLLATADLVKLRTVHRPYTGHFQKSDFSEPLIPLLESEYWSRMWIVQEFVLAQDLVFASGSVLVHWDRANHLFPEVYALGDPGDIGSAVTLVNERRQHRFRQKQGMHPDLHELFRSFRLMKCSDPRDRVFALFGLLGKSSNLADNVLVVDYSLTPAQLCIRIVRLASRSLKRKILEELHGLLDAALEVNQDNLDTATNKELSLIYEGIPDVEYDYRDRSELYEITRTMDRAWFMQRWMAERGLDLRLLEAAYR